MRNDLSGYGDCVLRMRAKSIINVDFVMLICSRQVLAHLSISLTSTQRLPIAVVYVLHVASTAVSFANVAVVEWETERSTVKRV